MIGIVSTGVEAIKNEAQIDGIKKAAFITTALKSKNISSK